VAANRREFLLGAATVAASAALPTVAFAAVAQSTEGSPELPRGMTARDSAFMLERRGGTLTGLRFAGDAFPTNYVGTGQELGHVLVVWRRNGGAWQKFDSSDVAEANVKVSPAGTGFAAEYRAKDERGDAVEVTVRMEPKGREMRWSVALRNLGTDPVEVGDLALPLPMHSSFGAKEPPTASVLKHHFVSGHGSYLFWMRSNSIGPYLVMTPERDTHLEYWDHTLPRRRQAQTTVPALVPGETQAQAPATVAPLAQRPAFRAYIHSVAVGEAVQEAGGRWRQPRTSLTLAPAAQHEYAFQLAWAQDYAAVQQRLFDSGLIDLEVAPGMTVPQDLSTMLAIRSREKISLIAEHPEQTRIESLGYRNGRQMYRVTFSRLGENLVTVNHGVGRSTRLEFFSAEPLETLIHKRAAFISKHQVRDNTKWYDGLLCEWAMDTQVQLGPENYDRIKSWRVYEVTCDDPGLSKPAYLASKNAEFPEPAQVEALDYYIEHFVWGGLQRTTEEKYSYGIYGILDWKQNRDSPDPGNKGKLHIWRPYDYPHIVVMYFSMYKIARDYPGLKMKMDKTAYLERAYGTALAMFTVPMEVTHWSAYKTGFYNEAVIPQLMDELEANGRHEEASTLRGHWEKKVAFFVTGGPNLFGSEYAFDSTGFESTQALARYAVDRPGAGGTTPEAVKAFALTQIRANLFCRGVVEKSYYYYGSDYRGGGGDGFTLTYMSPMGGWAVMDHALHDHTEPNATVRLGFASMLSSWALMNTGTAESGYGYWFPGERNDGGCGGGFEPAAYGMTWLGQQHHRGPWYYSSETDLGYCGALRGLATVVADDEIFGTYCFGGQMSSAKGALEIVPKDGVRRRLSLRTAGQKVDLELIGARFAKGQTIEWHADGKRLAVPVETEPTAGGKIWLLVKGLPAKSYKAIYGDKITNFRSDNVTPLDFDVPAGTAKAMVEIVRS